MNTMYTRTEALIGAEGIDKLKKSNVVLFGVGGVGGAVAEVLIRSGVGAITFIDFDRVDVTNLNRQIIALESTLNEYKAQLWHKRALDINPRGTFQFLIKKVTKENCAEFDFSQYTYIIDAIDDVPGKIAIIKEAKSKGIPIISSMGTGNKLDPKKLKIADINQTKACPLARRIRKELKKENISHVPVLYSEEEPIKPRHMEGNRGPSSIAFLPATAGLLIGSHVILNLLSTDEISS